MKYEFDNSDLTLKEIKRRKKALLCQVTTRMSSISDLLFIDNEDDDLENALKKELLDEIEESRCQKIMCDFDMWALREYEYELDCKYWIP